MSQSKYLLLVAGAALGFGQVAVAGEPVSNNKDEIRAVVAEMLADAETRSSLLAAGAVAGHDGKFFLGSADGNYRLNVGGDIQFRYYVNINDSSTTGDDFDPGFRNRLARLHFDGNVVNPDWFYKVQVDFAGSDGDGSANLEDAFTGYNFGNGWRLQMGQFKLPLLREELVDNTQQLAMERSFTNSVFTGGRSQGVMAMYQDTDWNFWAAFSDGTNAANTDWTSANEADWAVTARFQYKFAGQWQDFDDFGSKAGEAFSFLLGAAANIQQSRNTSNAADTDITSYRYTIDASLEGDGWNLFGAFIGDHTEVRQAGPDPDDTENFGLVFQGGYRWNNTELFARWDAFMPDDNFNLDKDMYNFVTLGVNQYYAGHAAKATIDCVIALDETGDLAGIPAVGGPGGSLNFLPNTNVGLVGSTDDTEVVFRFQFQLMF